MNLKKMIEENLVLSVLGLLAVGFAAGWGADYVIRGELINLRVQLLTEKVSTLQKEIEKKDNVITQKTNEVEILTKKSKESERRETDYQATVKALDKRLTGKDGEAAAQKEKHEAEIKKHQDRNFSLEQNVKAQSEEIARLKKDLQEASSKAASASKESSSTTTVNVKDSPGSTAVGVGSGGQVNIQNQPRLPELSKNLVGTVVNSVFPDHKSIRTVACEVAKGEQIQPLMFIVYDKGDPQKRNPTYFSAIGNNHEKWETVWNHFDDSHVFDVSGRQIEYDKERLLITFQGCFPHFCSDSWGFLLYDIKNTAGWVVRRIDSSDGRKEKFEIDFPLEFPSDLWTLFGYEEKLISNLQYPQYIEVLQRMPSKRLIPPIYTWNEIPKHVYDDLPKSLRKQTNLKIERVFYADTDGDGKLETVVFVDEPAFATYVIKGERVYEIPKGADVTRAAFIATLPVPGQQSPDILLGGFAGSGGYPFGEVYRWDGSKYKWVPDMKKSMMKEFRIQKPLPGTY